MALQEKGTALMQQMVRTARHVQRVGEGLEGSLSIGFVGVALSQGLPALIAHFHAVVPDVSLALDELPSHALVRRLLTGQTELAFLRGEPHEPRRGQGILHAAPPHPPPVHDSV